jgi:CHAT domain-containing protein/tetratricopeptide (TPR) repeat protein
VGKSGEMPPDQLRRYFDEGSEAERQFAETGDPAELDRALGWWAAMIAHPEFGLASQRDQRNILNSAGKACWARYEKVSHAAEDLDRASAFWRKALDISPASSPGRAVYLNNVGGVFAKRYEIGGKLEDLEAAVADYREAVAAASAASERVFLHNLASVLFLLWQRTCEPAVLEEAIDCEGRAATATAALLAERVNVLGIELLNRSELREAMHAAERSVDLTPPDSDDLPLHLNNLAEALRQYYLRTGDLTALDAAVRLWRRAEGLLPASSPERPRMLHNLGKGLRDRYLRRESPADLNEAIELFEKAEQLVPGKAEYRPAVLNALGAGLLARWELTQNAGDLNRAVASWEEALDLAPPGDPTRPLRLDSLGVGLRTRFAALANPADLDRAVDYLIEAVRLEPQGSPDLPGRYNNLANALSDRYTASGDPADAEAAEVAWQGACRTGLAVHPEAALAAARGWGNFASGRGEWAVAAQAYSLGAEASEQLFHVQLLRGDKESWLHGARGLHAHGAYALARAGDVRAAVTLLEKGRARLLADTLERDRAHLERLQELGHAELYERYTRAAARISVGESREVEGEPSSASDLAGARAELNAAIEAIQQIAGYEDLFRPPTFEHIQQILATPDCHAAVYLVVTYFGGAALVVDAAGARQIPLDLDLHRLDGLFAGGYVPAQMGRGSLPAALKQILPAVGAAIAGPVAAASRTAPEPREPVPHIVLIPTGSLALLPLHAAEYSVDGKTRCLLDEFAVSYAPSARVLGYARDALARCQPDASGLLAISNPATAGAEPLQFAAAEVEEIAAFFPGRSKVLAGEQATQAAVEQALDQAAYLHFACHGRFRMDDPLRSSVLLSGGAELTVADLLARERLSKARLAVLSACQTAIADFTQLPDESVGLPAGFLQAGAPAVIGSLWPVDDISTALLMIELYRWHRKPPSGGPLDPARALRRAQLWLRDVTAGELSELFAEYKTAAPDRPSARMAYATAREQFVEFAVNPEPNARPFAGAYNWAAFSCYGV